MLVTAPLPKNNMLLCQQWTEYQTGWGMSPDGFSYHVTEEDHAAYVERHWRNLRAEHDGDLPDVYDGPNGDPYWWHVSSVTYNRVIRSPLPGLRLYSHRPAAPEGALNVWRSNSNHKDIFVTEHGQLELSS